MKKIIFISRSYLPQIGGVEKHLQEITKILSAVFLIEIITGNPGNVFKKREKLDNILIRRITIPKTPQRIEKFIIWRWLFRNKAIFSKAEIIHCHDVFIWYAPFRFLFPQKPVFTTFHGFEGKYPVERKAILVRKASERLSKGNICVGKFISKWYGTKSGLTTYGGVRIPTRVQSVREKGLCVFVGRLAEDTGLKIYIKAIDTFNKNFSNGLLKVEFVGDGPLLSLARRAGSAHGFQKSVSKFFMRSKYAFTSGYLSILEAMAHKRLVFAVYNNPIKYDYLTMTPFADKIVIAGSAQELADKLTYYINHPEEEKAMIKEAFEWVKDQTWDKVADTYLKLWGLKK